MPTPFPGRFQRALQTGTAFRRRALVTVSRAGNVKTVEPTALSITQDSTRGMIWDGSMTIEDPELIPSRPSDLLTPFGTLVEVALGIELQDGAVQWVPAGQFYITSVQLTKNVSGRSATLNITDLADRTDRYRFEYKAELVYQPGASLKTLVDEVMYSRTGFNPDCAIPSSVVLTGVVGVTDPVSFGASQESPWTQMNEVARNLGWQCYYNRTGDFSVRRIDEFSTPYPVNFYLELQSAFDTRPPNVIVVHSENLESGGFSIRGIAEDTDPNSPTYAGGGSQIASPYGRTVEFVEDNTILTQAVANERALRLFKERRGEGAKVTLNLPYDPTIDVNDQIRVDGVNYIVDSVSLDFTGQTSVGLREVVAL